MLLDKNLEVEAAKKSTVINISYEGPTPEQCQSVVAELIDSYLDEHLRLNRTRGSHQFFADQTGRLRDELARRETELRDLKNKTGLASPDDQRQLLVVRIGRLEDDLLSTEAFVYQIPYMIEERFEGFMVGPMNKPAEPCVHDD